MRMRIWRGVGAAAALAMLCSGAGAASDDVIYSWRTADGTYAFTDDPDAIPARYRQEAESRAAESLDGYGRLTVADGAATERYAERLSARLASLRALNAQPAGDGRAQEPGGVTALSISTGGEDAPRLDLQAGTGDAPIVVEKVRVRPKGQLATRHDTVVRQGDRTIAIVKPHIRYESNAPNNVIEEQDLLE